MANNNKDEKMKVVVATQQQKEDDKVVMFKLDDQLRCIVCKVQKIALTNDQEWHQLCKSCTAKLTPDNLCDKYKTCGAMNCAKPVSISLATDDEFKRNVMLRLKWEDDAMSGKIGNEETAEEQDIVNERYVAYRNARAQLDYCSVQCFNTDNNDE